VADEAKQLHDEINNLVAKHGEKRIRNLLSRRLQAQANNMSTEQEETISLGEIDPKLLSRETLQDLIEALQQGARFDEASLTKLYQVVSSGSNS
jgi:Rad3-related DNA helicase